jgi:hypothetical protein
VAVFDPALPGRSISCNGSPVPFWRDRRTRTRGVEPIHAFERRRGVFLLRVRRHQRRVEIDDQRRRRIAVVVRGVLTGQRPHPRSGLSARSLYSHQRVLGIGGQGVNQPRHGRVRSDTAEHPRLGAQQVHIGHAVPAERQRDPTSSRIFAGSWVASGCATAPPPTRAAGQGHCSEQSRPAAPHRPGRPRQTRWCRR